MNLTSEDNHCLEKCLTFQAQIPVSEQMTKLVDGSTDQLVQRLELEQPVPKSMGAATRREHTKASFCN